MGVAGSGKSTVGAALARHLHVDFIEGDDYHAAENVARMASGIPLTDADRAAKTASDRSPPLRITREFFTTYAKASDFPARLSGVRSNHLSYRPQGHTT